MEDNWRLWCRLCAKNDTNNIDIQLFPDSNFSLALNHFFSIDISEPNQLLNTMVCATCHAIVERFLEFSQSVSRVQKMFLAILTTDETDLDLKELKSQYKVDEDNQSPPFDANLYEPAIQITHDEMKLEIDLHETGKIIKKEKSIAGSDDDDEEHQTQALNNGEGVEEEQQQPVLEEPTKPTTDKDVKCTECHKTFRNLNSMKRHLRKVHKLSTRVQRPKTNAVCEECGKVCVNRAKLLEHQLVHVEDRPFECRECGKSFKNKLRLKYHEDTHSTTSYICTICGIRLNSKPTLNMHMVVHSEEKRFKCDYCGNEYKRAKALKAHLILHTGLKPYSCDFCDRTFANGSNCRSHKKKAHPAELAALEAAGKASSYTKVPELKQLRAALEIPNNDS